MITWNQFVGEAQFSELDISAQELYNLLYAEIPNVGVYIVKYSGNDFDMNWIKYAEKYLNTIKKEIVKG